MSLVNVAAGELLVIQLGNGATPEVFAASATINTSRAIDFSTAVSTTEVPDAANPTLPAATVRAAKALDSKITGAGVADATSILAWAQWWATGGAKNIKAVLNLTGAQGGFTVSGSYFLTAFNLTGVAREKSTFTATLEQQTTPTITANA